MLQIQSKYDNRINKTMHSLYFNDYYLFASSDIIEVNKLKNKLNGNVYKCNAICNKKILEAVLIVEDGLNGKTIRAENDITHSNPCLVEFLKKERQGGIIKDWVACSGFKGCIPKHNEILDKPSLIINGKDLANILDKY
jgi:hypothetical protein